MKTNLILILFALLVVIACEKDDGDEKDFNEQLWGEWVEFLPCSQNTALTCDTFHFFENGVLTRSSNTLDHTYLVLSEDSLSISNSNSSFDGNYKYKMNNNMLTIEQIIIPIVGPPGERYDIVLKRN